MGNQSQLDYVLEAYASLGVDSSNEGANSKTCVIMRLQSANYSSLVFHLPIKMLTLAIKAWVIYDPYGHRWPPTYSISSK